MIYLDASVIVSAITKEPRTEAVQRWLANQGDNELCISGWTITEVASALSMKVRMGHLGVNEAAHLQRNWRTALADGLKKMPVVSEAFERAVNTLANHALGLRAGDALHIAIADLNGCNLATLDKVMASAARQLGVEVVDGLI